MKTRVFNHRKEYNNCNNVANGICVKQVIRKSSEKLIHEKFEDPSSR